MKYKIFITLLISIILCILKEGQAMAILDGLQAMALEELNYTLYKSTNSLILEPSKYYKLSLPSKSIFGPGIVSIKRMDGAFNDMPVFIDKEGIIRTPDGIDEMIIGMDGGYAEKFEVLLVAIEKDYRTIAKCTIIPFPLIAQDDKGHKIELQVFSPEGKNFSIHISGFKPNEQINMSSRSCNESLSHPLKMDDQGKFCFFISPAVIGKTEGPFEITIFGEEMKPLKMRHYWGNVAFTKPNEYKTLRKKLPFPEEKLKK